ncbi:MAG: hypothetical protein KKB30_10125 [Proteobacteria bacterium]|nr:hypothetical protein [Pseudomonadota bacterium]MBU1716407.1 hypothetical protein [Pseudomonadota bacterium]
MTLPSSLTEHSTPSSNTPNYHWGWATFLIVITLATLGFRYAMPIRDGDIWWHMLYGKYFLDNLTLIPDHTIFSWTPSNNDTLYCTWLADIFFYLVHKVSGLTGLFIVRYLCLFSLILTCFLYARKLKVLFHPIVWIVCLIALLMSYTAAFVKPEILSFMFMTLISWNWWQIRTNGEKAWRNCYLFPVIMLIWVNSHGGFIFGVIFLLIIGAGELFNTWFSHGNTLSRQCRKHLLISLILAAIAILITPYGYTYPLQLLQQIIPTQENINYNQKVASYMATFDGGTPFHDFSLYANLAILFLVIIYGINFKKKNIEWSSLLLNLIFAFLYSRFYRTTFYWAPIFMFSCISLLPGTQFFSLFPINKISKKIQQASPILLILVGISLSADAYKNSAINPEAYLWMGFGISEINPVEEAQYIKKFFPTSRIGNGYDQGAYLLWLLWPENRVFFDSRHFPYKKWSDEYFSFIFGSNVREMTKKYPCDLWCISLQRARLILTLLLNDEWKLAYYGKNSAVIIRSDIPLPNKAPRVSEEITNSKSLPNAINIFAFACNIKDWQIADKVLIAMRNNFRWNSQQFRVQQATYYLEGIKAYYEQNYQKAIDNIIKAHPDLIDSDLVLTNCFLALSAQAWKNNNESEALELTLKAWEHSPGNLYSAYNAGIILWYKQQQNLSSSNQPSLRDENTPTWHEYLEYFLKKAPKNSFYENPIYIAQKILNNEFKDRPHMILPKEL